MIRLVVLGFALVALTLGGMALHVPGEGTVGSDLRKEMFVALLASAAAVYLIAVALVLRRPALKRAIWVVLGVALGMRGIVLAAPPFLSSDVNRYVWDGVVQVAGINPYRYVPNDHVLSALRDNPVYSHINRGDYARTIYPPMAQIVFQAVARIDPTVFAMKVAMVAFEALAAWAMLRLLSIAGLPVERLLIYAWNPLVVWAFAGNGHVDAAEVGLLALALLFAATRRDLFSGATLGAATLVKFFPIVAAPALWRRAGWRLPLACAVTIFALYICYSSVGWQVIGFLPHYTQEEDLDSGQGVWLLAGLAHVLPLPPFVSKLYVAAIAVGMAALAAWVAFRPRPLAPERDAVRLCSDTAILITCATVAFSPHYPWYFAWLAMPSVVAPWRAVIYLSVAPVLMYLDPWHERFVWPCLVYLPAAALALSDWWQQRDRARFGAAGALERSL